jgi:methyltransferase (TIGR00027 family)
MRLPDLSYMMTVGGLRYIQSIHEPPERRNPDTLVRQLLTPRQRMSCKLKAWMSMDKIRSQPFYYYVLARTRYYDHVYRGAVAGGVRRIVNIGAGGDTRAYRFADELKSRHVRVLECDQPDATRVKELAARRLWRPDHVEFLAIDLNDDAWPALTAWLKQPGDPMTLVLLEGVSPYVNAQAFGGFLAFLRKILPRGSRVAYDFKLPGVSPDFGRVGRTVDPFRMTSGRDEVAAYHTERGYRLVALETGAELSMRLVPSLSALGVKLFEEDALVQLSIDG